MFEESFKGVLWMFRERLRGILRDLEGWFKGASRISKRSSKGVSRDFQGSFKYVLRKFEGCLKKMSSVFQENFKQSFKGVSKMFKEVLFCNIVLHRIHHSYQSRRRACFWPKTTSKARLFSGEIGQTLNIVCGYTIDSSS